MGDSLTTIVAIFLFKFTINVIFNFGIIIHIIGINVNFFA